MRKALFFTAFLTNVGILLYNLLHQLFLSSFTSTTDNLELWQLSFRRLNLFTRFVSRLRNNLATIFCAHSKKLG